MSSVVNLSISIGSRDFPVDAWRVMALKRYFLIASSNCSVFWTHFSVSESLSRRRWSILHVPSIGVHGILPPLWTTRMTYASVARLDHILSAKSNQCVGFLRGSRWQKFGVPTILSILEYSGSALPKSIITALVPSTIKFWKDKSLWTIEREWIKFKPSFNPSAIMFVISVRSLGA